MPTTTEQYIEAVKVRARRVYDASTGTDAVEARIEGVGAHGLPFFETAVSHREAFVVDSLLTRIKDLKQCARNKEASALINRKLAQKLERDLEEMLGGRS